MNCGKVEESAAVTSEGSQNHFTRSFDDRLKIFVTPFPTRARASAFEVGVLRRAQVLACRAFDWLAAGRLYTRSK